MRFAVFFSVFLCGFAVFGPPLTPPSLYVGVHCSPLVHFFNRETLHKLQSVISASTSLAIVQHFFSVPNSSQIAIYTPGLVVQSPIKLTRNQRKF